MGKKKTSLFIILSVLLSASISFSQNSPAAEDRTADSKAPEVNPVEAKEFFKYNATKAAMFNDGATQFVNALVKYELTAVDNALADKSFYAVRVANTLSNEEEYTAPFELHDEGKTIVEYYSIDKIGNKEQKKQFNITVDNSAPVSRVKTDRPLYEIDGKYYVSPSHLFSIDYTDNLSGVAKIEFATDGQSYNEYIKVFNVAEASEAVLKVRSVDNVCYSTERFALVQVVDKKEVETSETELVMTVDSIAPTITITPDKEIMNKDGRNNVVYENYLYTLEAADDASGVAKIFYRLDKAEVWQLYEKPVELSIYGEHRIEAMAVDNVGNASVPVALQVFIDVVPPPAETTAD